MVKVLQTTAMVMHILFETIEKRIYKSANGHLSTRAGVGLYPLTGMVLIYRWNNSACLAPECNHTLRNEYSIRSRTKIICHCGTVLYKKN